MLDRLINLSGAPLGDVVWLLAQMERSQRVGSARAVMLAAVMGLIILGFGLVALVWLGGRFARRYRGSRPAGPSGQFKTSEWATRKAPTDEGTRPSTMPPPD